MRRPKGKEYQLDKMKKVEKLIYNFLTTGIPKETYSYPEIIVAFHSAVLRKVFNEGHFKLENGELKNV